MGSNSVGYFLCALCVGWADPSASCEMRGIAQNAKYDVPAAGPVSALYGPRRHPLLGYAKFHPGQDYLGTTKDAVRAFDDGKVKFAGVKPGYGNIILIDHGASFETLYAHLSLVSVDAGSCVARGQNLGLEGSSGLSSNVHLHFEIRKDGSPIDPALYLPASK